MTLLTFVGINGNNKLVPLCWAFVPIEDEEWWSWFLRCVKKAFQIDNWSAERSSFMDDNNDFDDEDRAFDSRFIVFISDRNKGLANAVQAVFPGASHSHCCQHLLDDVHRKFGKEARNLFWPIARARTKLSLYTSIEALQNTHPEAAKYLSNIGYTNFTF
jgi:hypothetical protein